MSGALRSWATDGGAADLYEMARAFIVAGGAWSAVDWSEMDMQERAIAYTAGDHVARERAVMMGNAARDRFGAAEVISPVDLGDQLEVEELEAIMRKGGRP